MLIRVIYDVIRDLKGQKDEFLSASILKMMNIFNSFTEQKLFKFWYYLRWKRAELFISKMTSWNGYLARLPLVDSTFDLISPNLWCPVCNFSIRNIRQILISGCNVYLYNSTTFAMLSRLEINMSF